MASLWASPRVRSGGRGSRPGHRWGLWRALQRLRVFRLPGRVRRTCCVSMKWSMCDIECLLLERLSVDCEKESELSFVVRACPWTAVVIVVQDNTILSAHSLLEHEDVAEIMDIGCCTEG